MVVAALVYVALACVSLTHAQFSKCNTQIYGSTFGTPLKLEDIYLPPLNPTWDVPIPQACPSVAGVQVTVCDPDAPPIATVIIQNLREVFVQRNAYPIRSAALVQTVLYCDYYKSDNTQNEANAPIAKARN